MTSISLGDELRPSTRVITTIHDASPQCAALLCETMSLLRIVAMGLAMLHQKMIDSLRARGAWAVGDERGVPLGADKRALLDVCGLRLPAVASMQHRVAGELHRGSKP